MASNSSTWHHWTPFVVAGILLSSAIGMSSCSRYLDYHARQSQAHLADLKAAFIGREEDEEEVRDKILAADGVALKADNFQKLDILQRLEWTAYDWRVQVAAKLASGSDRVGLVLADNKTVIDLGHGDAIADEHYDLFWPRWPVYGRALRELRAQGAQAVAFDVLFPDRRFSDDALVIYNTDAVRVLGTNSINSDEMFAAELARPGAPAILAVEPESMPEGMFQVRAAAMGDASSPRDADSVARRVRAFTRYRRRNPQLDLYAHARNLILEFEPSSGRTSIVDPSLGTTNILMPDSKGAIPLKYGRFTHMEPVYVEDRIWHLGIVLAAQGLGLDLKNPEMVSGGVRLHGTNGITRFIPTDDAGYLTVDWQLGINDTKLFLQRNLTSLLQDHAAREFQGANIKPAWTNKLVVIGSTASGSNLADRGATPLKKSAFLVTTHLNVARMVLDENYVRKMSPIGEALCISVLGLLSAALTWRLRGLIPVAVVIAVAILWVALALWLFVQHRYWLPVAQPLLGGLLLHYAGMVSHRAIFEQREQQRIRSVFNRMVSPDIVQEVLRKGQLSLDGTRRQVTIFFADIRGFTEMTDNSQLAAAEYVKKMGMSEAEAEEYYEQQAGEVLRSVNRYLSTISDVIKFHRGTLDKYIGDCVMAFWGAPTTNPRHAVDAVVAAVDSQLAVERLNSQLTRENEEIRAKNEERNARDEPSIPLHPILSLGSGLNTGNVTFGLMGSEAHIMNCTVFGREVNLASRFESASGHARILIGETTFRELERYAPPIAAVCLALPPIPVKGFRLPVPVYEVPWRTAQEAVRQVTPLLAFSIGKPGDREKSAVAG